MSDAKFNFKFLEHAWVNLKNLNRYALVVDGCSSDLDVESFTGIESLSNCYKYTIRFTSVDRDLEPHQLLRKSAKFYFISTILKLDKIFTVNEPEKVVYGVITHFKRLRGSVDQAEYEVTLEPNLSLLRYQQYSYRFFLNMSVPQVVDKIISEHKLTNLQFEFNLDCEYPQRTQITQVNESDLAFIERLLAELGIYYYFDISPELNKEVVFFSDKRQCYPEDIEVNFNSPSGLNDVGKTSIWGLSLSHKVVPGSVQIKDYNYKEAEKVLLSNPLSRVKFDDNGVDNKNDEKSNYGHVYKYLSGHSSNLILNVDDEDSVSNGKPLPETLKFWATLEHERLLSRQTSLRATSNESNLKPGLVFTISNTDEDESIIPWSFKGTIRVISLHFTASRSRALSIDIKASPCTLSLNWRPELKSKPKINGTLVARISKKPNASTDPDNSKPNTYADLDNRGLYWVKFDADLDERSVEEASSMPVRLARPYAGDTYGFHFPLIEGVEVAIAFHEGNPDRPYIAHALQDSRNPDLVTSDNNTRNVIRTSANNKLRMEDKQDKEHIKLSTEYGGKSQLNLGHLVNSNDDKRGEGFELRTDAWGAIRAGKGLFISANERTEAQGQALDMAEALQQLQQAGYLVESLRDAAKIAKAELADLEVQKQLIQDTLEELKQAGILLSAPKGIAQITPSSLQLSAGKNLIATSGDNTDISSFKAFRLAAGEKISLFAQKMGIKLFAAKGDVEVQAQDGNINFDAEKNFCITSSKGKLTLSAEEEILLVSGGAYIRIGNGAVEINAPDKIVQKAPVWQKVSNDSLNSSGQAWNEGKYSVDIKVVWPFDDVPVKNQKLEIVDSKSCCKNTVKTNSKGYAPKQIMSTTERFSIYFNDGNKDK